MAIAKSSLPVINTEITIVSSVPMVRHETDFAILLYDFSAILHSIFGKKKAPLDSRRAYKYHGTIYLSLNHLLKQKMKTHTHAHTHGIV